MKRQMYLAISLSIVLVGGATFVRLANAQKNNPGLVSVTTPGTSNSDQNHDQFWYQTDLSTGNDASDTPLTNSDILGRSLIYGYIDKTATGQVTDSDLESIASQYVDQVQSIIQPQKVEAINMKVVVNSPANFQLYANSITTILNNYQTNLKKVSPKGGALSTLGPDLYSSTNAMAEVYVDTAEKLKTMPVPAALVNSHVKLVNIYLSNAASLASISSIDQDATKAFSGLVALNKNLDEEENAVGEINTILSNNGL